MQQNLHIVLGGAKSGKTAYALSCAVQRQQKQKSGRLVYLACAEIYDDEMAAKVHAHKIERSQHNWHTIEEPIALDEALKSLAPSDIVVIDSMGMWISNILMREQAHAPAIDTVRSVISDCPAHIIAISDETGMALVPEYPLGRIFRDANGICNQQLCAQAVQVDFLIAGLCQRLK